MSNPIVHLTTWFLRLVLPPSGRRRRCAGSRWQAPLVTAWTASAVPARHRVPLLRGEDSRLVRPYLDAHEAKEQTRSLVSGGGRCGWPFTVWMWARG
ncbi:hypothetical protein J7E93_13840 [Streptomyces sp. ISL-36]|uniref:hypothetical protein n=1 Tax=Streptomyces sp. ISL-36 TaxID=2819182 RepID=UPI001BEBA768|nr:hypothetical protein [Streptomyces sp. ISL-36]MBT2441173.1 hypothetical protein [Streptomyces sp. ISL-36]